ncbi:MAG TPA: hypothetical protein VGE34_00920 [Candidatus Saccharimonadales bacterium]
MNKQVVIINGVKYDPVTGLRASTTETVDTPSSTERKTTHALHVHKTPERTKTLSRSHVKTPEHPRKAHHSAAATPVRTHLKSSMIHKFAPATTRPTTAHSQRKTVNDIAPVAHPATQKAAALKKTHHQAATPHHQSAQAVKEQAIAKALHAAKPQKQKKLSFSQRHPRLVSASAASLAVVLLAGYLTYLNLPSLSVRVAAIQAGIAANYPSYQPSGYSLNGPVAYSGGKVSMKFAANVGPQNFTVDQSKTNWDSSALLENYVMPSSDGQYDVLSDGGLTIYTFGSNAAWVNGGILYTINGDAPLSQDQIRKIAASM